MLLPGGLWRGGGRRRDFAFKPLTGEVELAMAEQAASDLGVPGWVTGVLAAALEHVGGEPADRELVRDLCVGDRQFLARRLAGHLGRDAVWLTADCGHCGEGFDFHLRQSALPVKEVEAESGADPPRAEVATTLGTCRLRPPTGADQEAVAVVDDDAEALRVLVRRCLLAVAGEPVEEGKEIALQDHDLEAIEAALEAVSPEVALIVRARCPECDGENDVWVDPYLGLWDRGDELFAEIHTLAAGYGWSEDEILRLPRTRRQIYLRLMDRARGMVQ
jgi:hypothetical protein